jgi:hypothetical protein
MLVSKPLNPAEAGFFLLPYHYIPKILLFPILPIFVDSVFDSEESDEWGIATARGDIISDVLVDESFIECEYIITLPSFEELTRDRHTGSGDDRHVSIKRKSRQGTILDEESDLYDVSTDAICFSIADIRILWYPLVRRVARVFDDEIRGGQK